MGARGNSGVITSQIFRGMADGLGGKRRFNGLDLAHALSEGARTAYGAVAKPVEGTILTVIRESAAAAVEAAQSEAGNRGLTNVQFRQCTADNLPFPSDSFDVTVSRLGAMFFPEPELAFREMLRVTKPGGVAPVALQVLRRQLRRDEE